MRTLHTLKELREARGLSQRDLAQLSGIAQPTVGQLERGERKARPSTLRKLAQALGVEPGVLLVETEQATTTKDLVRPDVRPVVGMKYTYDPHTKTYTSEPIKDEEVKSWLEHCVENDDPSVEYGGTSPGQELSEELTLAQMHLDSDLPEDLAKAAQLASRAAQRVTESIALDLKRNIRDYEALPDYYYEDPASARRVGEAAKSAAASAFEGVKLLQKFQDIRDDALNRLAQQTGQQEELLSQLLCGTSPEEDLSKPWQQEVKESSEGASHRRYSW